MGMASILFVSKPVAPPWNDSGKNLVRDLARGLTKHQATLMVRQGASADANGAIERVVYPESSGGFAPALVDQARVFAHLLTARNHALWHFFFAPNPKSCAAGRASTRLRRMRSLHTVSSAPRDAAAIAPRLFADVHAVLSDHTYTRMREAGVSEDRLVRIAPAISPLDVMNDGARRAARTELGLPLDGPLVVYPGDLEFGEGGHVMIEAQRSLSKRGVQLVMACRAKTAAAKHAETALRQRAESAGLSSHVHWLGETPHIHKLLGAADMVCLPSTDLYAKMDYPLVLLEAMSLERPVLVARGSAAQEIAVGDAALVADAECEAVAATVERCLDDPSAMRALGARARRAVDERYSLAVMARAYESVYDRLVS
jgi:phosphatidylinositol alpha-1,6-mannosyltransferase